MIEKLAEMPTYEAYKDSGVEWLGEIPAHWQVKALKHIAFMKSGETISPDQFTEDGFPVFGGNGFRGYTKTFTNEGCFVLIGRQGALCGNVNYAEGQFFASEHAIVVYPLNNENYFWLGESIRLADLNRFSQSAAQPGIAVNVIKNVLFTYPPLPEQTAIADFLDRKTAQIDQAVAIKAQQIALLKERKQILIQNAVTRGLDPNVPMRDSGVEWIGEIPAHWIVVSKMKYISSLKGRQGWQGLKAEEYRDEGPYVLSSAHFNNYIISWEKCPRVSVERYLMDENIQLQIGDILLMKDGANMGKLAFVDDMPGLACLNSHLLLFRPLQKGEAIFYNPKFMFYHMLIDRFQDYVKVNGTGSTFLGISQESIGNYPICLPTLDEQAAIVTHIETQSAKIDQAIAIQQQQIDKLKEYKATLINSAVTGKIKVPTAVASKDASS